MPKLLTRLATTIIVGLFSLPGTGTRALAQTYPIDCAILLCLSGGWPTSVPCSRARIEFIRRITPWPIEPPLQIWRCPMGASYQPSRGNDFDSRIYDILIRGSKTLPQSSLSVPISASHSILPMEQSLENADLLHLVNSGNLLKLIQDRADIDISGPEFNFVRSIRVYDVRYARQHESGRDGDCNRSAYVVLGTYGTQGDFAWSRSSTSALPEAHIGLERWGERCPNIYHRSVFVDWQDYEGNYGFEQVNY
jgi:hypothetical protein